MTASDAVRIFFVTWSLVCALEDHAKKPDGPKPAAGMYRPAEVTRQARKRKPTPPPVAPPANPGYNPPANSGPVFAVNTVEIATPPTNYFWAIPWCECILDTRYGQSGSVQIDYLQLWAQINGVNRLICDNEFDSSFCGGLYERSPVWYGNNGQFVPFSAPIANGFATVSIADPTVVAHWYTCGRGKVSGATKVWAAARIKITGAAAFDMGWDFWTAEEGGNDREGATTRWYSSADTPDWTVITIGP